MRRYSWPTYHTYLPYLPTVRVNGARTADGRDVRISCDKWHVGICACTYHGIHGDTYDIRHTTYTPRKRLGTLLLINIQVSTRLQRANPNPDKPLALPARGKQRAGGSFQTFAQSLVTGVMVGWKLYRGAVHGTLALWEGVFFKQYCYRLRYLPWASWGNLSPRAWDYERV